MKKVLICTLIMLVSVCAFAGPGDWSFYKTTDTPGLTIGVQRVSTDSTGAAYYSVNMSGGEQSVYKATDPTSPSFTLIVRDDSMSNGFQGMCSDSSNNFYAMGESGAAGSGALRKFDSSGNLVTSFGTGGVVNPEDRMTGMDIMSDDNTLIATTFGGQMWTFDATTGTSETAANTGSGNYVRDLAVQPDDGAGNDVIFFNQSGDLKRITGGSVSDPTGYTTVEDWGTGITNTDTSWQVRAGVGYFAADDTVIYANKDDNQVYVVNASTGDLVQTLGSGVVDASADVESGDFVQPSDAEVFVSGEYDYLVVPMAVSKVSIYRKQNESKVTDWNLY